MNSLFQHLNAQPSPIPTCASYLYYRRRYDISNKSEYRCKIYTHIQTHTDTCTYKVFC